MISIDLGSNTFRCIAYDCITRQWGADFEKIVKTADGLHATGVISESAVQRILQAIEEARQHFDFDTQDVKAVTTAAMRLASNADSVLEQIKRHSGIVFEIIDAEKEAYFTTIAVQHRLQNLGINADRFVLIDIGGGSTEVIFVTESSVESRSFDLGIVTLAQQCETPEQVHTILETLLQPVKAYVKELYAQYGKPQTFVSTAGTPTTIAAFLQGMTYETYDVDRINGYHLSYAGCESALKKLLAMGDNERATYVGVGRETLIVAGVVIVQAFYKLLGFESSVIIDDGVREGVALDFCHHTTG